MPHAESVQLGVYLRQLLESRRGTIVLGSAGTGKSSTISAATHSLSFAWSAAASAAEDADTDADATTSSTSGATNSSSSSSGGGGGGAAAGGTEEAAEEADEEAAGEDDSASRDRSTSSSSNRLSSRMSSSSSIWGPAAAAVQCRTVNPKAVTTAELLGVFNETTKEWSDGISSLIIREYAENQSKPKKQILIFDGPIDSLWVESLNTVLDDNQMLCLPNGKP